MMRTITITATKLFYTATMKSRCLPGSGFFVLRNGRKDTGRLRRDGGR